MVTTKFTVGDYVCNHCGWYSSDTSRPLGYGTRVVCPDCLEEARFAGSHEEFTARRYTLPQLQQLASTYIEQLPAPVSRLSVSLTMSAWLKWVEKLEKEQG